MVEQGIALDTIESPSHGYFGPSYTDNDVKEAIDKNLESDWEVKKVSPHDVAKLLQTEMLLLDLVLKIWSSEQEL